MCCPSSSSDSATQPPRIALPGTSMGGQGASADSPLRFPAVSRRRGNLAGDRLPEACAGGRGGRPVAADVRRSRSRTARHRHPVDPPPNWPRHQFFCCDPADPRWYDSVDRLRMKLASLGVLFECDLETTGGGHGFGYYNQMAPRAVNFLGECAEQRTTAACLNGLA